MPKEQWEAVATEAMRRMYEDPFWEARFGERGRKYALEDGLHHLGYLDAALTADNAGVLVQYAQWLRAVLVPRGMCSLHLVENFARIGEVLAERGMDVDGRARRFLGQACEALRHVDGIDETRVVREATLLVPAAAHELRVLVSYLGDAVALDDPTVFRLYLAWARPWYAQWGMDAEALLSALRTSLAGAAPLAARMMDP